MLSAGAGGGGTGRDRGPSGRESEGAGGGAAPADVRSDAESVASSGWYSRSSRAGGDGASARGRASTSDGGECFSRDSSPLYTRSVRALPRRSAPKLLAHKE